MLRICLTLLLLAAAPVQAAEIKLSTWNLAWLTLRPAGDRALPRDLTPRGPEDFTRLAGYARRLDADIIALQEVDGAEAAARVLDPGEYRFFFADERDVQRTGFAVRRSLRVIHNADLEALDPIPNERFSLRRGTDITVEAGGRMFRLLSVHLKAGCREASDQGRDCDTLMRQSGVIAGWITQRRREGMAFAILGDFNRRMGNPQDAFLRELTAAAPLTRANEGVSNPCWSDGRGGRPFIDHILLGGPARDWLVPGSLRVMVYAERERAMRDRLSDHCPISIRLRAG